MSGLLLDVSALVHGAEERCKAECRRLEALVHGAEGPYLEVYCKNRDVVLGAALGYRPLAPEVVIPQSARAAARPQSVSALTFH